jgi:hypothetical protein
MADAQAVSGQFIETHNDNWDATCEKLALKASFGGDLPKFKRKRMDGLLEKENSPIEQKSPEVSAIKEMASNGKCDDSAETEAKRSSKRRAAAAGVLMCLSNHQAAQGTAPKRTRPQKK